jgi:hypothetical protein
MHVDGQSAWKTLNRLQYDLLLIVADKSAFCDSLIQLQEILSWQGCLKRDNQFHLRAFECEEL